MNHSIDIVGLIEHEVAILVRRAVSANTIINKRMKGLDRSGYLILRQLEEHGPSGIKDLAEEFRLDISTVSRQTGSLELKGYIRRLANPSDGRACFLEITEAGQSKLDEVRQVRLDRFMELIKDWTPEECEKFGELLSRLNRTYTD